MTIGVDAKAWREAAGLSQVELARELGISQPRLCAFENHCEAKPLGPLVALRLQKLSHGAIKAVNCVRPDKRSSVADLLGKSRCKPRRAA